MRGLTSSPAPYPVAISERLQADFNDLSRHLMH